MKRITNGKYVSKGYAYKGYEIHGVGYYPPEKCRVWEAVNIQTGEADYHAHSRREIKEMIDAYEDAIEEFFFHSAALEVEEYDRAYASLCRVTGG